MTRRNIEVKARLADPQAARAVAAARATRTPWTEEQTDVYFRVDASGEERVKLRTSSRHGAQLIRYRRPEASGVRTSDYSLSPLAPAEVALTAVSLGAPILTVTKTREVFLVDNVRVHLDRVEGLGDFLELEAMVDPDHDDARCRVQVDELLQALGVSELDLVRASYSDLLAAPGARALGPA
jgi:predicted adenylyl cyclase CyaB